MDADLDRLIRLQQTDTFIDNARGRISDHPALIEGLDSRLAAATAGLESAGARVAENQAARRSAEKDLAMIQARLSKFKGQLMEVKTNKEYTAMLKEIEAAQHEVGQLEDKILERMLEADDLAATQKAAEKRLASDKGLIGAERKRIGEETEQLQRELDEALARRTQLAVETSPAVLGTYETVRSRRGSAVVEVRAGYCSACHVRLRPQFVNELRRGETVVQCESCQRILFIPPQGASESAPQGASEPAPEPANGAGSEGR
jgi:predicted  nucleic acid-binding Zn-ribbon protein